MKLLKVDATHLLLDIGLVSSPYLASRGKLSSLEVPVLGAGIRRRRRHNLGLAPPADLDLRLGITIQKLRSVDFHEPWN